MLVTNEWLARLTGRGLTAQLIRGAIGIGMFVAGAGLASEWPYLGLSLMLLALVPIGGCPACWVGGVIEGVCEIKSPKHDPQSDQERGGALKSPSPIPVAGLRRAAAR